MISPWIVGDHLPGDVVQVRESVESVSAKSRVNVVHVELAIARSAKQRSLVEGAQRSKEMEYIKHTSFIEIYWPLVSPFHDSLNLDFQEHTTS